MLKARVTFRVMKLGRYVTVDDGGNYVTERSHKDKKKGYKFVSYIHEMENPHRISITIYGTTRHIQSLDVILHH